MQLVPMTKSEFEAYRQRAVKNYAQEHVRAGNWHPSGALQKAENDFLKLLPDGVASENQHLFSIKDSTGVGVGMIWFGVRGEGAQRSAFIYDFMIEEQFRGRGYGEGALVASGEKAKELGSARVSLHVFGHNRAAIALYEKVGYEATDLHMTKKLGV